MAVVLQYPPPGHSQWPHYASAKALIDTGKRRKHELTRWLGRLNAAFCCTELLNSVFVLYPVKGTPQSAAPPLTDLNAF
jgi:hypothetical protein